MTSSSTGRASRHNPPAKQGRQRYGIRYAAMVRSEVPTLYARGNARRAIKWQTLPLDTVFGMPTSAVAVSDLSKIAVG
jgi:hypothetical protein